MEEPQRKTARLLSALGDLKLNVKKVLEKQGHFEERRQIQKMGALKDEGEEIIFERLINIFRKKRPHDRKIISDCLASHFTFSYLEESIKNILIEKFNFCKVEGGQYLMKQGDPASCFFIIHQGRLNVQIDGQCKKKLSPADGGFGELSLLFNAPRSASIKAEATSFLWYIDRVTFKTAVEEIISANYNENKAFIDQSMYLSELSNGQRQALAQIAMNQYYQKLNTICKEGELASSFYILKSGRVRRTRDGVVLGYIEKGQIFQHEAALKEQSIRNQTLLTEENSHILALSIADIKGALGKSLPIMLIRNQLKSILQKQTFFKKLTNHYTSKLLDSFQVTKVEKGKTVIDTFRKKKNCIVFILEGQIQIAFPKFINPKSSQKIMTSMKEIKNMNKYNIDKKQLFGVQALRQIAGNQKNNDYYDINIQFVEKGKIAMTSLAQIEQAFGCTIVEALLLSAHQKEQKRQRTSQIYVMKGIARDYQLSNFSARKVLGSGGYGKVLLVSYQNLVFALKCISKRSLLRHKNIQFVKGQRQSLNIISWKDSPFFVKYYRSFKDHSYIYFLTEYIQGRDLFEVIHSIGVLSIEQARFYLAILIHILQTFHQQSIIYRDLKPENIMVGKDGYIKLIDLGTCKKMDEGQNKTFSFIGTPEYMAPQVFINKGYSYSADLWSLGTIFYQFLTGKNPFIDNNTYDIKEIYDQIMESRLQFPISMKDSNHMLMKPAKSLITQLLDKTNPSNRLGGSFNNLKNHSFFSGFDWNALISKNMAPAFLIKKQYLLSQEKIKELQPKPISTFLKDWNCELPKVKGISDGWDELFSF